MLHCDIKIEMVEHKICLLTFALSHIGHVHNFAASWWCTRSW